MKENKSQSLRLLEHLTAEKLRQMATELKQEKKRRSHKKKKKPSK